MLKIVEDEEKITEYLDKTAFWVYNHYINKQYKTRWRKY